MGGEGEGDLDGVFQREGSEEPDRLLVREDKTALTKDSWPSRGSDQWSSDSNAWKYGRMCGESDCRMRGQEYRRMREEGRGAGSLDIRERPRLCEWNGGCAKRADECAIWMFAGHASRCLG